jgi:hypothetical protein
VSFFSLCHRTTLTVHFQSQEVGNSSAWSAGSPSAPSALRPPSAPSALRRLISAGTALSAVSADSVPLGLSDSVQALAAATSVVAVFPALARSLCRLSRAPSPSVVTRRVLRQLLDHIAALESRRESASVDVSCVRPSSPTPSEASQASTPSTTSNNAASLDHALGLPDDELKHAPDKHLSKKWAKLLSSAKLTLDQKSTAAALNAILCLGRCLRHLSYTTDQLLASGAGHDDAWRAADEALAVTVDSEQELASILVHFSVLCSKTMGQHAGIIREAARIAREAELGDRASIKGMCVADRHVANILTSVFKKLSEQAIKDMYTKDKSSKKASTSPAYEEPAADLRKELEVTKKKLQQANKAPSTEGAGP